MSKPTIEVAGRRVELSKRDLVDYFTAVADAMVPHLRGKPLSMRRFPDWTRTDPPADLEALRAITRQTRDLFEEVGLTSFVQATGGRGFHIVAPLDGEDDYELVRAFARELAERLVEQEPDRVTVEQRKDKRGDRIFVDTNRNAYGQTAVTPYFPRARRGAPVATPIDWDELGRMGPSGHTVTSVPRRLARKSDPWRGLAAHAASARHARGRLS